MQKMLFCFSLGELWRAQRCSVGGALGGKVRPVSPPPPPVGNLKVQRPGKTGCDKFNGSA